MGSEGKGWRHYSEVSEPNSYRQQALLRLRKAWVLSAAIPTVACVVARLPLRGLLVRPSQCRSQKAYHQSYGEKDGLHGKPPFAPRHKTVIYVTVIKVSTKRHEP